MRVGTAGWSIPKADADKFPGEGTHLGRYARVFNCAEINTSFYRSHKFDVYKKWADQTPENFRFAVKLPREISHDLKLRAAKAPLQKFVDEIEGLGDRMGVLLVQLPPSFEFEARPVKAFFKLLRRMFAGPVACEPRHASWFGASADESLATMGISRVAADPSPFATGSSPGGWLGEDESGATAVRYFRWHGAPRMYYSSYESSWLDARARDVRNSVGQYNAWCIFDNTAAGHAIENALEFRTVLGKR